MAVHKQLAQGLWRLACLVGGWVADHTAQLLDEHSDTSGMDAVLRLLEADEATMPWIVQQGKQRQHAECAVGNNPGAEGKVVTHRQLYTVFPAGIVQVRIQFPRTGNQVVECSGDVGKNTHWLFVRAGFSLQAGQDGRQIRSIGVQGVGGRDGCRFAE